MITGTVCSRFKICIVQSAVDAHPLSSTSPLRLTILLILIEVSLLTENPKNGGAAFRRTHRDPLSSRNLGRGPLPAVDPHGEVLLNFRVALAAQCINEASKRPTEPRCGFAGWRVGWRDSTGFCGECYPKCHPNAMWSVGWEMFRMLTDRRRWKMKQAYGCLRLYSPEP